MSYTELYNMLRFYGGLLQLGVVALAVLLVVWIKIEQWQARRRSKKWKEANNG